MKISVTNVKLTDFDQLINYSDTRFRHLSITMLFAFISLNSALPCLIILLHTSAFFCFILHSLSSYLILNFGILFFFFNLLFFMLWHFSYFILSYFISFYSFVRGIFSEIILVYFFVSSMIFFLIPSLFFSHTFLKFETFTSDLHIINVLRKLIFTHF